MRQTKHQGEDVPNKDKGGKNGNYSKPKGRVKKGPPKDRRLRRNKLSRFA